MENSTREHQRYYIFVEWKNGTDIRQKLVVAEGDKALTLSTIYRWVEALSTDSKALKMKHALDGLAKLSHQQRLR
jgi:hypothetical protein